MNQQSNSKPFLIIAFTLGVGVAASWFTKIDPVLLIILRLLVGSICLAHFSQVAVAPHVQKSAVHFWGSNMVLLLGFCINEWFVWGLYDAWGWNRALSILLGVSVSISAISGYLLYRGCRHCQFQERGYSGWGDLLRGLGLSLWGMCYLGVSVTIIVWAM